MKKGLFCFILMFQFVLLYAELPEDEYLIFDRCQNNTIELGDRLSKVFDAYPGISLKGEKKYSNITYKEYEFNGDIFSISAYAESDRNARIRRIELSSTNFSTKKGIFIGCTQQDVLEKYGNSDRVRGNELVYLNTEYDHMELIFSFNDNGIINKIELVVGT